MKILIDTDSQTIEVHGQATIQELEDLIGKEKLRDYKVIATRNAAPIPNPINLPDPVSVFPFTTNSTSQKYLDNE